MVSVAWLSLGYSHRALVGRAILDHHYKANHMIILEITLPYGVVKEIVLRGVLVRPSFSVRENIGYLKMPRGG